MTRQLPRDAALPQLAQALSPDTMAAVFAAEVPGCSVAAIEVERIKYRPGRNCSVAYRLQLRKADGQGIEQRIAARFGSERDAARRHREAFARPLQASAAGPALTHDPRLCLVAHWLPNDARLDGLALLCDAQRLEREALGEVVAALGAGTRPVRCLRTTLAQYVPERRACARVLLESGSGARDLLYAKANVEREGAATHAVMAALHATAGSAFATPRPLVWQAATGLHWQCELPGTPFLPDDAAVDPAVSARVGEALAAFHATPAPAAPRPRPDALPRRIAEAAATVAGAEPAWRPVATRIAEKLEAAAPCSAETVTLHGDLHPLNLLQHEGRIGFVDLDDVQRGPAVLEIGGWVADALYRAVLDGTPLEAAMAVGDAFVDAYTRNAGRRFAAATLAHATALHLFCRRAAGSVANLKPGRYEAVPSLLALAEAIVRAEDVEAALAAASTA